MEHQRRVSRTFAAVVAGLVLAAAAGCGTDGRSAEVRVDVSVSVCREASACTLLPAAGARVTVLDGADHVVARGTARADGTFTVPVRPGTYRARAVLGALGLHDGRVAPAQAEKNGSADLSLVLLPSLAATPLR
ncbi:MAG: carboxypeptidase-like regulatory domain-containing protein [Marmoricola sp.]